MHATDKARVVCSGRSAAVPLHKIKSIASSCIRSSLESVLTPSLAFACSGDCWLCHGRLLLRRLLTYIVPYHPQCVDEFRCDGSLNDKTTPDMMDLAPLKVHISIPGLLLLLGAERKKTLRLEIPCIAFPAGKVVKSGFVYIVRIIGWVGMIQIKFIFLD